jgi:hypothetical protein
MSKWYEVSITAFKTVAIEVPDDWSEQEAALEAASEAFSFCDNTDIEEVRLLQEEPKRGCYDEFMRL